MRGEGRGRGRVKERIGMRWGGAKLYFAWRREGGVYWGYLSKVCTYVRIVDD